jgi:hypothetical protein
VRSRRCSAAGRRGTRRGIASREDGSQTSATWWFIEIPAGIAHHRIVRAGGAMGGTRRTITYCRYGSMQMKPTDIWTNAS